MISFKKKKVQPVLTVLIPLTDLCIAYKIARQLRETYEREQRQYDYYDYLIAQHSRIRLVDHDFMEKEIAKEICKHGYKEIDGKFYRNEDLSNLHQHESSEVTKVDETLYVKEDLSKLSSLPL